MLSFENQHGEVEVTFIGEWGVEGKSFSSEKFHKNLRENENFSLTCEKLQKNILVKDFNEFFFQSENSPFTVGRVKGKVSNWKNFIKIIKNENFSIVREKLPKKFFHILVKFFPSENFPFTVERVKGKISSKFFFRLEKITKNLF